jgi:hypothetical protein
MRSKKLAKTFKENSMKKFVLLTAAILVGAPMYPATKVKDATFVFKRMLASETDHKDGAYFKKGTDEKLDIHELGSILELTAAIAWCEEEDEARFMIGRNGTHYMTCGNIAHHIESTIWCINDKKQQIPADSAERLEDSWLKIVKRHHKKSE